MNNYLYNTIGRVSEIPSITNKMGLRYYGLIVFVGLVFIYNVISECLFEF